MVTSAQPDDHGHDRYPAPALAKFHAPEIVFGHGSLSEAGFAAARLGASRPFVVTDEGIAQAGWTRELLTHLTGAGLRPHVWSGVTPNPKDHEIADGYDEYVARGCDVIVAIGGGSVMDAAKGVAIIAGNGGRILDYEGVDQMTQPIPPMLMIPTTSGTGADVSQFCIVTDTKRRVKATIVGRALVPDISVTDPRLLTTMPEDLNAATGLDALTHGIEAYVSLAHNPLADTHALEAVRLVTANLATTMSDPDNFGARRNMAQASLQAGMAFSNAILGATHAMSHQVGGLLDLPHGVINGILLAPVIRYNALATPDRYRALALAAGLDVAGAPDGELADAFADFVRSLADRVGVPRGLADVGVSEDDIPALARSTLQDACLSTNPRPADAVDIELIFKAAL